MRAPRRKDEQAEDCGTNATIIAGCHHFANNQGKVNPMPRGGPVGVGIAGCGAELARDTIAAGYCAYLAADQGTRVDITPWLR
jgi:hypothetical protein